MSDLLADTPPARKRRKAIAVAIGTVTLVLLIIIILWWRSLPANDEAAALAQGPAELTAKELAIAFDKDPLAADLEYDNRAVTVTGPFNSMSLGPTGDPAITIGADPIFDVTAVLNKVDAPALAALPPGQAIRITCTNVIADPTRPSLSDCELHRER